MQVQLFKKLSNYKDKNGQEKTATNFFVECNGTLIPIEVKFFADPNTNSDPNFRGRKMVLSTFADLLPDRPERKSNHETVPLVRCPKCGLPMRIDDMDDGDGSMTYWWICEDCNLSIVTDSYGNVLGHSAEQEIQKAEKGENSGKKKAEIHD